jgi:hypothetical protein
MILNWIGIPFGLNLHDCQSLRDRISLHISTFDRTVFKQKTVIFGTKPIKVSGQKAKGNKVRENAPMFLLGLQDANK